MTNKLLPAVRPFGMDGSWIMAMDHNGRLVYIPTTIQANQRTKRRKHLQGQDVPLDMHIPGEITAIQPGVEAVDDKPAKLPTIDLLANTGEPMDLPGFPYQVAVDLAPGAVEFQAESLPIIVNHDQNRRLGHSLAQSSDHGGIRAHGLVSADNDEARGIVKDAKNGFPFQVSIGAKIKDGFILAAGKTHKMNGRTYTGPLVISKKTLVKEFTVAVLGADGKTTTKIAAMDQPSEGDVMFPKEFLAWASEAGLDIEAMEESQAQSIFAMWKNGQQQPANPPANLPTNADDPLTAQRTALAGDLTRISNIQAMVTRYTGLEQVQVNDSQTMGLQEFQAHAVQTGMDIQAVELALLRSQGAQNTQPSGGGNGPAIHINSGFTFTGARADLECQAMTAAFLMASPSCPANQTNRLGEKYGYEHWFKDEVLEAAHGLGRIGLHDFMGMTIKAAGHYYGGRAKSDGFIESFFQAINTLRGRGFQASPGAGPFSTSGITNILENVANKVLLASYMRQGTVWGQLSRQRSVDDFKAVSFYRLSAHGGYIKVGPNGELSHAQLSDTKYTAQAETRGVLLALRREDIRNDDMGAFESLAAELGRMGALATEEEFWKVFLALSAGVDITDVLAIAGLGEAEEQFRKLRDDDNKPILVPPSILVTGVGQATVAGQLFADVQTHDNTNLDFVRNPHAGKFRPVTSPYVDNTALTDQYGESFSNQSATAWWLMADPQALAVVHAVFLDGKTIPTVEQGQTSFDTLGIQWRAFHDWNFAAGDAKGLLKSTGVGGS